MRTRRGLATLLLASGLIAMIGALSTARPSAAGPLVAAPANCAAAGQEYAPIPWATSLLAPARVWPFARGNGIRVAVLDSGVDASHPLLTGRVAAGYDAVTEKGRADSDCTGSGTRVAGVIVAQPSPARGFSGLAPAATILPVRILPDNGYSDPDQADPVVLARAITWATAQSAQVICVPVPTYVDSPELRAAVTAAVGRGIVVVAAVGNLGGTSSANPTPYPAAYPGVLGVGAVDANAGRWASSQHGEYVDLVAPGDDIVSTQRSGGLAGTDGTGVAAGLVAGTVALVREAHPGLGPDAVAARLFATATPAGDRAPSHDYGAGIVNPYNAVTDRLPTPAASAGLPMFTPPESDVDLVGPERRRRATVLTAGLMLVAAAIWIGRTAVIRGSRRRWRSALAEPPPQPAEPAAPGPPVPLFEEEEPLGATPARRATR
ncbi:S8 family serine peptidase [Dactylosporangium sp. AC04546]|uniref:S8 family serine peptidase n=1 Tax=Dactylosporangium sp. AC04546 TaxID=2862460 RepID=UPI001EDEA8C2|nr:S8 family serine peptidase [Dactylosporangium sp. AC04546]WVK80647.1 S8 family serine peptidase [Dactylosporangium sp. AC04546]